MLAPAPEARRCPVDAADTDRPEALGNDRKPSPGPRAIEKIEIHVELHESLAPAHDLARPQDAARDTDRSFGRRAHAGHPSRRGATGGSPGSARLLLGSDQAAMYRSPARLPATAGPNWLPALEISFSSKLDPCSQ